MWGRKKTKTKKNKFGGAALDIDLYNPQRFINMLGENRIIPEDRSMYAVYAETAKHVPFSEIEQLIQKSAARPPGLGGPIDMR